MDSYCVLQLTVEKNGLLTFWLVIHFKRLFTLQVISSIIQVGLTQPNLPWPNILGVWNIKHQTVYQFWILTNLPSPGYNPSVALISLFTSQNIWLANGLNFLYHLIFFNSYLSTPTEYKLGKLHRKVVLFCCCCK